MTGNPSIQFFDDQFRRQVAADDFALNPFETAALPHLRGQVLDYGCGLGNLSVAAARRGCAVVALDASAAAIDHLGAVAARESLALRAQQADLRAFEVVDDYDAVVCIGLLMFFDCATADAQLAQLQAHVRPGGVAIVNLLVEGTSFLDMFTPESYCLLRPGQLRERFAGWEIVQDIAQEFPAPHGTRKVFETVIARRTGGARDTS